jgi:sucrose synthase
MYNVNLSISYSKNYGSHYVVGRGFTNSISFSFIRFKQWGFERGWGDTAGRVKDTMRTLSEVLQAPDPINMEKFFSKVPTIFNVVIFSIHGYFGQADVLGLPDTGGQVTF